MKVSMSRVVVPVLALSMGGLGFYHVQKTSQSAPLTAPYEEPPYASFEHTVAGAGIVEAQTENIAIGSALPGVVLEVFVPVDKVGQRVKAGDPLFLVDNRQLKAQLKFNEANLATAEANLAKLQAQPRAEEVPPSEANVRVAQAALDLQLDMAERNRRLINNRAVSEEDYRQKSLSAEMARRQLTQAKAQHALLISGAWEKDIGIAKANVALAKAQIEQTKTDLDRALVRAPVDGDVLQVNVRPGEYVGAPPSQALVVLGSIHQLHVRVDIDEHDIPRFRPGASARAALRGDPQTQYPLKFVRVEPYVVPKKSLTGDNTERVDTRVLQVIYALDTSDKPVYVGQQVDVFIQADANNRQTFAMSR
jgi:multidrug resistance efflux pump